MFRALPAGSVIEATSDRIVGLMRSLNCPAVSFGGGRKVQSRAYIVGVHNVEDDYTLYVALSPRDEDVSFLFCCDPLHISPNRYNMMEQAAMDLVKRYGFAMERIELADLSPPRQQRFLDELPLLEPEPSSVSSDLARILAGDLAREAGLSTSESKGVARPRGGSANLSEEDVFMLTQHISSVDAPARSGYPSGASSVLSYQEYSEDSLIVLDEELSEAPEESGGGSEEAIMALGRLLALF